VPTRDRREEWVAALRSVWFRLRTVAGSRAARAREDEEELQFHLRMAVEENLARGMSRAEAERAARRDFGGLDAAREASAEQRGLPWLETLARDLRFAARSLRRAPAFAATAVTVIALGVGGVCAIVPLVDAVLLEPLPMPQSERLVALWESAPARGWDQANSSPANLLDWRERVGSLSGVAGHGFPGGWALGGGGRAERVSGIQVTGGFFSVLGVPPHLGRDFGRDEHWAGEEATVVISDGLWRRRFAADPAVIGRRLELDGRPYTIVGVAAPGLTFPQPGLDVWVPFGWHPPSREQEWFRRAHFVRGFGRLAPGVTVERARAELAAVAESLAREYPATNAGYGGGLTPLHEWVVGDAKPRLVVLLGAVGLLLLVACANVASLLFARAGVRAREMALRGALGASRTRLMRQLLTETLLLAGAGGLAGVLLGFAGARLLVRLAGDALPRAFEVGLDASVLALTLLLVLATGLLFGVGPGSRTAATPPAAALRGEGRAVTADPTLVRSRGTLVLAEMAMAMVLLAGAGLAIRSFTLLVRVDPGFRAGGLLAASYDVPVAAYPAAAQVHDFHRRVQERVRAIPGVAAAELASSLPLEGMHWTSDFVVEGREAEQPDVEFARRIVTPGYFAAMGVRRLAGPGFPATIDEGTPLLVVVNETMARRISRAAPEAALGKRVRIEHDGEQTWRTVVGVVADERVEGLARPAPKEMFVPTGQEQRGEISNGWAERGVTLVVRAERGDPRDLLPSVVAALAALDADIPLYDARTLEEMLAAASARERLLMVLLAVFAGLALALATVGVYGLIAFAMAQRRREIGIRVALGAGAGDVVRSLVARAAWLCGAGLLLGLLVAALAGRLMAGVLYGVRPADPATLAGAAVALAAAATLAASLPAWRATRVDPLETLRE
jgi:predicted permease